MDIEYVTKLVDLVSESKVDEIEIEEDGKKIRIAKSHPTSAVVAPPAMYHVAPPLPQMMPPSAAALPSPAQPSAPATVTPAPAASASKLHEVRSPIVGTFYRSPAPDAPPFVQIGSTVAKGGVLCIVEAMKLMNEIESDIAGKIVEIRVENGQPVEYDQVLFVVDPA